MRTIVLLSGALLAAGCNSEPEVDVRNASAGEVAGEVARAGGSGEFVSPGLWESKVTFEEMSFPGMTEEMAAQMKGFAGRIETHRDCLTPEEARRPKEDFFAGDAKNCRYDHFTMGGGKIDAAMKCTHEGSSQTMAMQGSYSPDTYNMRMTMTGSGGGDMAGMTMTMRVDAKRVGECTADEAKAA